MIRFSALLVAVATVLLIAGVVTSKLALVYVAIGVSALALVTLGAGAGLKRHELFGQTAEAEQARQSASSASVPSASVPSAQPEAVSVAANGSAVAAGGSNPAGTKSSAPWESGATGWGQEATAWGSDAGDAPPVSERASSVPSPDPFPASSAWPPAPSSPVPPAPAGSGWSAPPETDRFDTGHAAPGLAAHARPVGAPEYGRPDAREAPAEERAEEPASSSASLWSATATPRQAPSGADDARLTTAMPARPAPEVRPDAADATTDAEKAERTAKPDDDRPWAFYSGGAVKPGISDAEAGTSDVRTSADADADTPEDVADDASADVIDGDAVSAANSPAAAADAGDRPDGTGDRPDGTTAIDASTTASGVVETTPADTTPADTASGEEASDTDAAIPERIDGSADGFDGSAGGLDGSVGGLDGSAGGLDGSVDGVDVSADTGAATGDAPDASADSASGESAADGPPAVAAADAEPAEAPAVDLTREVTTVPGVPRYHDAHCILIRFMGEDDLEKMTLAAATEAGCTPCRACLPEHDPA